MIGSNFLEEKKRANGRTWLLLNVLEPGILSSSLCPPTVFGVLPVSPACPLTLALP